VRDEYAHDILEIQTHLAQIFLYLTRRDARINEYSPLTRPQIIAVTATSAGKTPEYKPVFLHINNSACKGTKKFAYIKIFL